MHSSYYLCFVLIKLSLLSFFCIAQHSQVEMIMFAAISVQAMGCGKSSVQPLPLDTPVSDDQVRFVCMSDTHSNAAYFSNVLPPGDVFLHAGDFTYHGLPSEVEKFNEFLGNNKCRLCCFFCWFRLQK